MLAVEAVEVGQAEVQLVARQAFEYLLGAQGVQLEAQARMHGGERLHQAHRIEAGQRHHAQAQGAHQLAAAGGRFGVESVVGRQQGARPGQHAQPGIGEALEALTADHQLQAELFLQAAQAHGQRWLGHVAARCGLAEVAGFLKCDEELQLLDVHAGSLGIWRF
ncbi:hypothetical protein D3C84_660630 [compost metagenome]